MKNLPVKNLIPSVQRARSFPEVRREGGCCQLLSVEIPRGHALAPNACASSRARSAPLHFRGMFRGPGTRGRQGLDSRTRYYPYSTQSFAVTEHDIELF